MKNWTKKVRILLFVGLFSGLACFLFLKPSFGQLELPKPKETAEVKKAASSKPEFNAANYGAKPNDSNDDTKALQAAIDAAASKKGILHIPAGTFLVNTDPATGSLNLKDNMELRLHKNTILKAIPNDLPIYRLITVYNQKNIKISGGTLVGDRDAHTGTDGEFGHGIMVGGSSSNIQISNIKAQDFWGDGFILEGNAKEKTYPTSVTVSNVESHNNRRQGISVTAGRNIIIKDSVFSKSNGTPPEAGIDLERDPPFDLPLENVKLINNQAINNEGYGIAFIYANDSYAQSNVVQNNKKGGFYIGGNAENGSAKNNTIHYNFISNNGYGIFMNFSTDNNIAHNVIEKSAEDGISLVNHVGKNRITKNLIRFSEGHGIYIWGGLHDQSDILVQFNESRDNKKVGLFLINASHATVIHNDLHGNTQEGLRVKDVKESIVKMNKVEGNGK